MSSKAAQWDDHSATATAYPVYPNVQVLGMRLLPKQHHIAQAVAVGGSRSYEEIVKYCINLCSWWRGSYNYDCVRKCTLDMLRLRETLTGRPSELKVTSARPARARTAYRSYRFMR